MSKQPELQSELGDLSSLEAGSVVDGREVIERLGVGGMGAVYKARHLQLGRLEAIKIMHPRFCADPGFFKRFQREGQAVSQLKHENIVRSYSFGIVNGVPYFAMEYLDGQSLGNKIRENGPMPAEFAVPIFLEVCAALACAHRADIIHRDLKPDNVMLVATDSGITAKVVDFGLAKICYEAQKLTLTGEIVGDPRYMSPEQCQGQQLDARSDIYSFGCLMYEVLTGSPPFDADSYVATMYKRLQEDAPPFPKELSIPKCYEEIVFTALALDKKHRFKSVAELADQLNAAFAGQYESKSGQKLSFARPNKPTQRTPATPTSRLNLVVHCVLAASVGLMIGCLIILSTVQLLSPAPKPLPSIARGNVSLGQGRMLLCAGKSKESLRLLHRALTTSVDPADKAEARHRLVWAYEDLEQFDQAQRILEQDQTSMYQDYQGDEFWMHDAENIFLKIHLGEHRAAEQALERLREDRRLTQLYVVLASRLYFEQGRTDEIVALAEETSRRSYNVGGSRADLLYWLSNLCARAGKFDQAKKLIAMGDIVAPRPQQAEWARLWLQKEEARVAGNEPAEIEAMNRLFKSIESFGIPAYMFEVRQLVSRYRQLNPRGAPLAEFERFVSMHGLEHTIDSFLY